MTALNIYLLREGVRSEKDAVNEHARSFDIADGPRIFGKLFVKATPEKFPKWAPFFRDYVDINQLGKVQSTAAVLIVRVDERFFAVTFGHGRFILRQEAIEERFGLLVTLNVVKQDSLRSVDKRAFLDERNSRVQTNHASPAVNFGINIEQDLIRGIVGHPDVEGFGTRLAGSDSLSANVRVELPDLRKLLRRYLQAFNSTEYRKNFPWIDKIRQLRPRGDEANALNDLLIDKLEDAWKNNGILNGCWMSIPDVIDWTRVKGFKYTRSPGEGAHSDLHLPGFVSAYPDIEPSIEVLKNHYAMAVDDEDQIVEKWSVYKCIHCEVTLDNKSYIFSAGHWFAIDIEFENEVERSFREMPIFDHDFPLFNHEDELAYNTECAQLSGGSLCLMDQKNLSVGGIHDKVEFCDLYGDKSLIHVKKYGSSSVLGHLFNQGLVSAELLKSHKEYVGLANKKLGEGFKLELGASVPRNVSDFVIVFCIVSQSTKPLNIPFFAKVVLKNVCTRLRELGYGDIRIAKIDSDPLYVLTRKLKRERTKRKSAR